MNVIKCDHHVTCIINLQTFTKENVWAEFGLLSCDASKRTSDELHLTTCVWCVGPELCDFSRTLLWCFKEKQRARCGTQQLISGEAYGMVNHPDTSGVVAAGTVCVDTLLCEYCVCVCVR